MWPEFLGGSLYTLNILYKRQSHSSIHNDLAHTHEELSLEVEHGKLHGFISFTLHSVIRDEFTSVIQMDESVCG